jgi:hypothetical protein
LRFSVKPLSSCNPIHMHRAFHVVQRAVTPLPPVAEQLLPAAERNEEADAEPALTEDNTIDDDHFFPELPDLLNSVADRLATVLNFSLPPSSPKVCLLGVLACSQEAVGLTRACCPLLQSARSTCTCRDDLLLAVPPDLAQSSHCTMAMAVVLAGQGSSHTERATLPTQPGRPKGNQISVGVVDVNNGV